MLDKRIKDLRGENNLSQQKLAAKLGVTQQAVAKWENNKAEPDSEMLIKLSNIFNVSIDYLLGRTDICNPYQPETIAVHHKGEEFTEEELKSIEQFKEFVRMRKMRKNDKK